MELHEYPRPANDTGIGIHWTVGYATAVGQSQIREFWLPELKSMGVKWVKIFNHDGALDFCELLLAEDIMPIVRLYRPSPNPGRLGVKELVYLDSLIRAGVRYFEFNNEPDVDAEWKGGRVPVNGIELTVDNTIANLEIVLERGGMPAIPAVANGSRWDLVGKIVAAGRKDLFAGPVWQAIHNYSQNRPLDYPYDIGNQEGAAFTERFYRAVGGEAWNEDAWRGRNLAEVNRLRYDRRSPGATIMDDHACFLAYEYYDALNRKHLGRSIPILSTECGYLVGEDIDPRYPATTPDLHMAQTLEACRVMMGTSQRFKLAPDYYFCTAFWLLANELLGSTSPWWETHAWYSDRWLHGGLPVARALQAEPKVARIGVEPAVGVSVMLHGVVAQAPERSVVRLEADGKLVARAELDEAGRFEMADLVPGDYMLRVESTGFTQPISVPGDQREVLVRVALPVAPDVVSRSVVAGHVRGGAGAVVMLVRSDDGEEWVTMARDDGGYRFIDLSPGVYSVRVHPAGSHRENIVLDGRNQVEADLAMTGWGYTVRIADDIQKVGAIVVTTPGRKGLRVQAHSAEWSSEPVLTGAVPEYGEHAAIITPLEVDYYMVTVDGAEDETGKSTQLEARVHVDKRAVPLVEFVLTPAVDAQPGTASKVMGVVIGARRGQPVQVLLADEQAQRRTTPVDDRGHFVFDGLGAGSYQLAVIGFEDATRSSHFALDGKNQVELEIALPGVEPAAAPRAGASIITGVAPASAGRLARLLDAVGNERRAIVDSSDSFAFEALPAGVFTVLVEGGFQQGGVELDGANAVEVEFAPVIAVWETTVSEIGSMPGFSSLRVEVEGMPDLPVRVAKQDEDGQVARTSKDPERGSFTVEFRPLGPGMYVVEPETLGIWTPVELTGLEAIAVSFRRKQSAVSPNTVRQLSAMDSRYADLGYLFLAAAPATPGQLERLLRLVNARTLPFGMDVDVASQCRQILLLDDGSVAGDDLALRLGMRGADVIRSRGNWDLIFDELGA